MPEVLHARNRKILRILRDCKSRRTDTPIAGDEIADEALDPRVESLELPFRTAAIKTIVRVERVQCNPCSSTVDGQTIDGWELQVEGTAFDMMGEPFPIELYEPREAGYERGEEGLQRTLSMLVPGAIFVVEGPIQYSQGGRITVYGGKLSEPERLERLYVSDRDGWSREVEKL